MVASFSLLDKGWEFLAFTIGFGVLVIKAPTFLQDFWQSTGLGKSTQCALSTHNWLAPFQFDRSLLGLIEHLSKFGHGAYLRPHFGPGWVINPSERLIFLSPLVPDFTNQEIAGYYTSEVLRNYEQVVKETATKYQEEFLDLTAKMEKLEDFSSYTIYDGQHYSEQGIKWLANQLVKAI